MKKINLLTICCCLSFLNINSQELYKQTGIASFYADKFEGRITANGEKFNQDDFTAAHLTLPFNTWVKITNLENNKSVEVRINDRGPFVKGRIIDLSRAAATELDFIEAGVANVKIEEIIKDSVKQESKLITGKAEEKKPATITETASLAGTQTSNVNPYYLFNINLIAPMGYGVQIGSYKEMVNLARLSEKVKAKYQKEVIVQVTNMRGEKIYRIILGTFTDRNEAENYKNILKKEYKDCFVVSF